MSFPRYPSYKESFNPWIGSVPGHWEKSTALKVVQEKYVPNTGLAVSNLLSLSFGKIICKDINTNDGLLPESFETYQVVEPNDIVFRPTDLQNDWNSLRSAIVREQGIITSAYIAVSPTNASPDFLNYLFRAYDHCKVFYSMGGGLRQAFKFSDIRRLPIYTPPIDEQHAIASFLDRETAKIDSLVAEQRRLVELLKEKRQAVISHAVTKGLDPTVPMKPSGIEWLGDVPEHWETSKIKHLCYVNDGNHGEEYPSETDYTTPEDGVPFIRGGNLDNLTINSTNMLYITKEKNASMRKGNVLTNDILFVNRGDIGKLAVIPAEFEGANLNSQIAYLRPQDRVYHRYLMHFLCTKCIENMIDSVKAGSVLTQFPIRDLINIAVPLPSLDEQKKIADWLDELVEQFTHLIDEANRAITLLQERRTALISAAVTGKIDVRGIVLEGARP